MGNSSTPLAWLLKARLRDATAELARADAALLRRCDRGSVHAFRVATRRARSLLWSAKPWVRRSRYRELAANLRAMARKTARLRDLEVLAHDELAGIVRSARLSPDEWRQLRAELSRERRHIRDETRRAIQSAGYRRMFTQTRSQLREGQTLLRKVVPHGSGPWLKRIARGLARLKREARAAHRRDLHRIRVRVKRCRYALEASGQAGSRRHLPRLRSLQSRLGRYCDCRVACAWLSNTTSIPDAARRRRLLHEARRRMKRRARLALQALHAG